MFDGVAQLVGQDCLRRVLGETYLEETGLGGREGIQCLQQESPNKIILRCMCLRANKLCLPKIALGVYTPHYWTTIFLWSENAEAKNSTDSAETT